MVISNIKLIFNLILMVIINIKLIFNIINTMFFGHFGSISRKHVTRYDKILEFIFYIYFIQRAMNFSNELFLDYYDNNKV